MRAPVKDGCPFDLNAHLITLFLCSSKYVQTAFDVAGSSRKDKLIRIVEVFQGSVGERDRRAPECLFCHRTPPL